MFDLDPPDPDAAVALARELSQPCTCGVPGAFCPACGDYTPAVTDPEVVAAFAEAQAARRRPNRRVIRKELPR